MVHPTLRTLVVDDEPVARSVLAEELAALDGVQVIGAAENGVEAVSLIQKLAPDVVFLDIQMPAMDGFEALHRLQGPLPAIIFVTAYSEHALRAFEIGAVDYLLKPFTSDRLAQALERAREARRSPLQSAERVARTLDAAEAGRPSRRRKVVGRRGSEFYLLDLEEVFAFQAEGELVWILTAKAKYLATQTLQAIEDTLVSSPFQRVHRGAIVNTDRIRKVSGLSSQRWLLTLTNGLELTVSKRQAPLVRDLLR